MDAIFWHSDLQLRGQQKQRKRWRNKINTKNQNNKLKKRKNNKTTNKHRNVLIFLIKKDKLWNTHKRKRKKTQKMENREK